MQIATPPVALARRPRAFVRVSGPDARDYLQRMVSNDVDALAAGESCEALLLTPKARVIAPLLILCRGADDFLLLTEPELGAVVRSTLLRARFAAKAEIELEEHDSLLVLGEEAALPDGALAVPNADYGVPAFELIDAVAPAAPELGEEELDRLRIVAGSPRFGREIDDRVLPAEAGLVERCVSFGKGCYPGQEPVARLRYRGHANRSLRVLVIDDDELPGYDAEIAFDGKAVGRVTSSARRPEGGVVALGYLRVEVPSEAELRVGSARARQLH